MSTRHEISATANGFSTSVSPYYGQQSLLVTAATWDGTTSVTVEVAAPGSDRWCPAKDMAGQAVTVSAANTAFLVPGGVAYRLNVSSIGTTSGLSAVFTPSAT